MVENGAVGLQERGVIGQGNEGTFHGYWCCVSGEPEFQEQSGNGGQVPGCLLPEVTCYPLQCAPGKVGGPERWRGIPRK